MQFHERDTMHMQALALLQWRAGRMEEAREIFQEAVDNCKPHAPLWAAWASVEVCARAHAYVMGTSTASHYCTDHRFPLASAEVM